MCALITRGTTTIARPREPHFPLELRFIRRTDGIPVVVQLSFIGRVPTTATVPNVRYCVKFKNVFADWPVLIKNF